MLLYVPYKLPYLDLKLLSARLFYFSIISQLFGAIMYFLEPKGGGVEGAGGPLYCLILSETMKLTPVSLSLSLCQKQ
jgi:hypothetical protein